MRWVEKSFTPMEASQNQADSLPENIKVLWTLTKQIDKNVLKQMSKRNSLRAVQAKAESHDQRIIRERAQGQTNLLRS